MGYMSYKVRKRTFWHVRLPKIKSACTTAQSDQSLRFPHDDFYILGYPKCSQWRFWSDCTGCSESSLGAQVRRYVFWRCDSYEYIYPRLRGILEFVHCVFKMKAMLIRKMSRKVKQHKLCRKNAEENWTTVWFTHTVQVNTQRRCAVTSWRCSDVVMTFLRRCVFAGEFVCVEVLRPSQPNGVAGEIFKSKY